MEDFPLPIKTIYTTPHKVEIELGALVTVPVGGPFFYVPIPLAGLALPAGDITAAISVKLKSSVGGWAMTQIALFVPPGDAIGRAQYPLNPGSGEYYPITWVEAAGGNVVLDLQFANQYNTFNAFPTAGTAAGFNAFFNKATHIWVWFNADPIITDSYIQAAYWT